MMPIISHKSIADFLARLEKSVADNTVPPVFLIYGEEMLYKSVLDSILNIIVAGENRGFMYEPFDGLNENVGEALRSVNTYALLQGRKVVSLLDSRIFYSKQDTTKFPEKEKDAHDTGELKAADALVEAIDNGFPKSHFLIVTTDTVDKRRRLFKIIQEKGLVIDCSVPRGDRQSEKAEQDAVLRVQLNSVLEASQKSMSQPAYALMVEMTGFDLRTFSNNLAKLVDYVGQRKNITPQDVETLLHRTRQDPIYTFTNALTDKNVEGSFFYMRSLLDDNFHPLQILSALANHLRKLLIIRDFLDHSAGISFNAATPFNSFRSSIMPQVKVHDQALKDQIEAWQEMGSVGAAVGNGGKKKKKPSTDLLIAPNPNNPYPIYKLFQKAHQFSGQNLVRALTHVSEADVMLKSSRQKPEAILDRVVIKLLGL